MSNEGKEKVCGKPATVIMHWAGSPSTAKCDEHWGGWQKVASAMGMPTPSTSEPYDGEVCQEIVSEVPND